MEKEKIAPWLERLNAEPDGRKRNGIVAEMCKEHGLKTGDAWQLLKLAGFDPKSPPNGDQNNSSQDNSNQDNNGQNNNNQSDSEQEIRKTAILVSHKTAYEKYRCAGLALTRKPENYLVTPEQLAKLRQDPWVDLKGATPK